MDIPAPAFIQESAGRQADAEPPSPVSSLHGSPGARITRALPNGGHWGSPNTDPPMGDGAGAEHKALPTLGALTGLPLVVSPMVLGQG